VKRAILSVFLILALVGAASAGVTVTSQVLDYEKGWLFLTTGDGFRVAPNVDVVNGPVATRRYARVTFDASGVVTKIEVSRTKLPAEGDIASIHRYAVAL
jgi:hypothetical protein